MFPWALNTQKNASLVYLEPGYLLIVQMKRNALCHAFRIFDVQTVLPNPILCVGFISCEVAANVVRSVLKLTISKN